MIPETNGAMSAMKNSIFDAGDHKSAKFITLLLLALYLLSSSLRIDSGDGERMYRVSYSLVSGQGVAIPVELVNEDFIGPWGELTSAEVLQGGDGYGKWGIDGRYYAKYGIGWSLVAVPFCALGRLVALVPGVTEGFATRVAVSLLNPLLTALAGMSFFYLARYFYSSYVSLILAILYSLGTIAWYYAKSTFSEPLVTLLLMVAIYAVKRDKFIVTGLALGGMVVTRQMALLPAMVVIGWVIIRGRVSWWKNLVRPVVELSLPLVIGQVVVWSYNAYRFGSIFEYGYRRVRWDTPLFLGIYSQLLSPGKGLFVFMPILFLGVVGAPSLYKKYRSWIGLSLALVISQLVPYALYGDWAGGGGWGARFLLPIVPYILLPGGELIRRWQRQKVGQIILVVLMAVSLFIQVLGVSVNWARHLQRVWNGSVDSREYFWRVHYCWECSPILGQIRSLREAVSLLCTPEAKTNLQGLISSSGGSSLLDWQSEAVGKLSLNVLDFWFVYFWFLGAPVSFLIVIAVILLSVIVVSVLKLRCLLLLNESLCVLG